VNTNFAKPSLFVELQRRNVYKVGATYGVGGWLLVQVATQVFPFFDISNASVRWVVIGVAAGFPVALVLAWIFDVTPRGIARTAAGAGEAQAAAHARGGMDRKLNYVLGSLLLIALGYFAAERGGLVGRVAVAAIDKSVAVLPLVNSSGDPSNEYFSDGLSDELISVLAKVPGLKVIGRNSSFHFKNSSEDSHSIGGKLGVANLLEGSVSRQGERVRIVAELVSAADGRELWSETYDRELKDVFAVQSEIAQAVAEQLKVELLGGVAVPHAPSATRNLAAYNALLQGDFFRARLTEQDERKAADFYDEAIRLDPAYAPAYARLSMTWRALAAIWLQASEVADGYERARRAAQQALALAPELGEAHEALAWVLMTPDLDFSASEAEMRRAVALGPTDEGAQNGLAYVLAAQGRLAESEAAFRRAIELDPLAIAQQASLARMLIAGSRVDEAESILRRSISLQPKGFHQYVFLVMIDVRRHDDAAARRDAQQELEGFWRDFARALAAQTGMGAAADTALQGFALQYGETGAYQVATLYAVRKDPDRMFDWLDRSYRQHDSGLTQLLSTPFIGDFKSDPRFLALCGKLKIDPAVLADLH
jgi:serine/threonine-protein kinase